MEREGGGREAPFSRPNDQAQDERGRIPLHSKFPLTLTLSREGRGDDAARRAVQALDSSFSRGAPSGDYSMRSAGRVLPPCVI